MRKRDYKAEYERRKQRAVQQGFQSYHQKRKTQVRAKDWVQRTAERMKETGLIDSGFFDDPADSFEDDDFDDSLFWEMFRNYYGKGNAA